MRIIAGRYKGLHIDSVDGLTARPTTDYTREVIFSTLYDLDIDLANVLDLYAGSGALGLEALSRGAEKLTSVEASKKSVSTIISNIKRLKCENQCKVILKKVDYFIKNCDESYDLILADPPYDKGLLNSTLDLIFKSNILSKDGVLVFEHTVREKVDDEYLQYLFKEKNTRNIAVSFFARAENFLKRREYDNL